MPLPRRIAQPTSLRQMLGLEAEVGQVPSGEMFNRMIPESIEKQREANILGDLDARTSASMQRDLAESEAVREARNRGFQGSFPLQEQEQYGAEQKLRQILLPKQMELEAKMLENQTGREFNASQGEMNRASRERIAQGAQAGQASRVSAQQAAITSRMQAQQDQKRNPISKFYSWITGSGSKTPEATATPAVSGDSGSGMVMMQAPTGEQQMVPAARVQEFLAKGAVVVD